MRKVNEILLNIWENYKGSNFSKVYKILKKLAENYRQTMKIVENLRIINNTIRNN